MEIPIGYGQATFVFLGSGLPHGAVSTIGFKNETADTVATIADNIRLAFEDTILEELTANQGLGEVRVKLGPGDLGPSAVSASGQDGGDASPQAPPNVTYLVHKRTALGGRKHRGRMYLPGVAEDEVVQSGGISSTKLTALATAVAAFETAMTTMDLSLVILHNDETVPTAITSLDVSGTVATQRRRLRR